MTLSKKAMGCDAACKAATSSAWNLTLNYQTYLARVPEEKQKRTLKHTKFIPFTLCVEKR